ncbi:hypothetical protein TNCV_1574141 [Trichonephila clavipes]|nr:hypothetical protein TNCV_1574141 [Trichonephila clavipes]
MSAKLVLGSLSLGVLLQIDYLIETSAHAPQNRRSRAEMGTVGHDPHRLFTTEISYIKLNKLYQPPEGMKGWVVLAEHGVRTSNLWCGSPHF